MTEDNEDHLTVNGTLLYVKTLEQLREELISNLKLVKESCDVGSDDWRYRLLNTYFQYSKALAVDPDLLMPLLSMVVDVNDEIKKDRLRTVGELTNRKTARETIPLNFLAACVTVLKDRGAYPSVEKATWAVARAAKVKRADIQKHRDAIHRGSYSNEVRGHYTKAVETLDGWPTADIMGAAQNASRHGFVD